MKKTYSVGQMAQKLGRCIKTLQRWDNQGVFVAYRTPAGRRFYTEDQVLEYFGKKTSK